MQAIWILVATKRIRIRHPRAIIDIASSCESNVVSKILDRDHGHRWHEFGGTLGHEDQLVRVLLRLFHHRSRHDQRGPTPGLDLPQNADRHHGYESGEKTLRIPTPDLTEESLEQI